MWPLLVAMLAVSVAVAVWPLRPTWLKASVLIAHLLITWVLVATLGDPWQMWFIVFLPGMLIAVVRLLLAAAAIAQRLRGGARPIEEPRSTSDRGQEIPGPHDQ